MNLNMMTEEQIRNLVKRAERELAARRNRAAADAVLPQLKTILVELQSVIELIDRNPSLILCINKNNINDFNTLMKQVIEASRLDKQS